ncbi:hypothetical protein ABZ568_05990 [Streptomyces olindensis]|uniref:Uncharacterized protein n=1 Tax=Streptomyces olindensis TaxID=358823 RepID=A0ABV2XPX0_9ACTN
MAQPIPGGDNGDVKIHASATRADDQRNDPKVCDFYLAAFNFDPGEKVNWTILRRQLRPQEGYSGNVVVFAHLTGVR